MHLKFDSSVYEMSCVRCWLPSNSLNSVIYQDLSSFQVYIGLFHFPLMCMHKSFSAGQKNLLKKVRTELINGPP